MHFSDLSYELGRNARGLYVLASAYGITSLVEGCTLVLPFVANRKLRAEVLKTDYTRATERVYILKPGFWMGMVRNDYEIGIGSIVVASDNLAFSEHGIDRLVEELGISRKLGLFEGDKFKEYLIKSAIEMIIDVPKKRLIAIIE